MHTNTIHNVFRSLTIGLRGKKEYKYPSLPTITTEPSEVQDKIHAMLLSDAPCMISRFGSVELQAVVDYLNPPTMSNAWRFVKGKIPAWGYAPSTLKTMRINAGFFPANSNMLNRFGELMMECMMEVDMLGSWRPEEAAVMAYMPHVERVPLYALEPYYFDNSWTPALEGKRVLVIHPFENTIRKQHARYDKLFADKRLTPHYELLTIKAVQSIAGNKPDEFDDWFEALEWMKREIDKQDFDIAIIGCGAYGFPLAAYVKSIGKKAIHLGGAVANMFGINSTAVQRNKKITPLVNEYWVYPSEEETPKNIHLVEQGRYW